MQIHEILKEQFFIWDPDVYRETIEVTDDVHNLAREVGNCQSRITEQRKRLWTLERLQAGYAGYWQRRAEAAERILREIGDAPVSERSSTLETVSAYYLRRYTETRDELKRVVHQREHAYWGHNDL